MKVTNQNIRDYFDDMISAKIGMGLVDVIKVNGDLKGMIIGELIHSEIEGKSANIYHIKMGVSDVSQYPGLMKILTLMRGFSLKNNCPDDRNFTYCVALSGGGFATFEGINRFPVHPVLTDITHCIIAEVYKNERVTSDGINGCYYIADNLQVNEPEINFDVQWPKLPAMVKQTFKLEYYRSGKALVITIANDQENEDLFKKSTSQLINTKTYNSLQSFYAKQIFSSKDESNQAESKCSINYECFRPKL